MWRTGEGGDSQHCPVQSLLSPACHGLGWRSTGHCDRRWRSQSQYGGVSWGSGWCCLGTTRPGHVSHNEIAERPLREHQDDNLLSERRRLLHGGRLHQAIIQVEGECADINKAGDDITLHWRCRITGRLEITSFSSTFLAFFDKQNHHWSGKNVESWRWSKSAQDVYNIIGKYVLDESRCFTRLDITQYEYLYLSFSVSRVPCTNWSAENSSSSSSSSPSSEWSTDKWWPRHKNSKFQ